MTAASTLDLTGSGQANSRRAQPNFDDVPYPLITPRAESVAVSEPTRSPGFDTPAGRYFFEPPSELALLPVAPRRYFVCYVGFSAGWFDIAGRPTTPADLAAVLASCPEWRGRPIVVVAVRDERSGPALLRSLPAVADAIGAPVLTADGPISVVFGRLLSSGQFHEFRPGPVASEPTPAPASVVGSTLPPLESRRVIEPASETTVVEPVAAEPVVADAVVVEPIAVVGPAVEAEPVQQLAAAVPETPVADEVIPVQPGAVGVPVPTLAPVPQFALAWPTVAVVSRPLSIDLPAPTDITVSRPAPDQPTTAARIQPVKHTAPYLELGDDTEPEDRNRLRALLGWRYEAHARGVTRILALHPGLRATAGDADVLASLVAVRAYLSDRASDVDAALRAEAEPGAGQDELAVLARCALSGLRRLPAFLGPVFRSGGCRQLVAEHLAAGVAIVEPGFLDASSYATATAPDEVRYVIWSATARRTETLGLDPAPGVGQGQPADRLLFGAGTSFGVLDVVDADSEPLTVYLRELTARQDAKGEQVILQRLREAAGQATATASTAPALDHPLGLTLGGQLFAATTTPPAQNQEPSR